ncbi:MAG TPA: hypothetical protein VFD00_07945 [Thermoclostridium sp.]|nr:hypothetical protein [Thermoclostridium sp.]
MNIGLIDVDGKTLVTILRTRRRKRIMTTLSIVLIMLLANYILGATLYLYGKQKETTNTFVEALLYNFLFIVFPLLITVFTIKEMIVDIKAKKNAKKELEAIKAELKENQRNDM